MKKGFTLIEILITLGIVGVIAALTLPNMIKNHQKRVLVTQLQRTYNAITNAMPTYMDEVHATRLYDTDAFNLERNPKSTTALENFVSNNFKTSKICTKKSKKEKEKAASKTKGTEACYGKEYKDLNGNVQNNFDGDVCAILKTGATLCFYRMGDQWEFPTLNVDVNGPQGPNIWGRDAYNLEFNNAGDLAESFADSPYRGSHYPENCEENSYGSGCFDRIVEKGWVMDY